MTENKNPFLKPYNTPHDTAPFHLIKIEHYAHPHRRYEQG